jgi:hypothetical protein
MSGNGTEPSRGRNSDGGFSPDSVRDAARIAENEPTRFPARERGIYLQDSIREIEKYQAAGKSIDEIKTLMFGFAEAYPKLFDMVTRPSYDKAQVRTMLSMLDKMGTGELSQHQASVIVGQKLLNKYVTPSLRSNPPSER